MSSNVYWLVVYYYYTSFTYFFIKYKIFIKIEKSNSIKFFNHRLKLKIYKYFVKNFLLIFLEVFKYGKRICSEISLFFN